MPQLTITKRPIATDSYGLAAHRSLLKRLPLPVNVGKLHHTCHSTVPCSTAAEAELLSVDIQSGLTATTALPPLGIRHPTQYCK